MKDVKKNRVVQKIIGNMKRRKKLSAVRVNSSPRFDMDSIKIAMACRDLDPELKESVKVIIKAMVAGNLHVAKMLQK